MLERDLLRQKVRIYGERIELLQRHHAELLGRIALLSKEAQALPEANALRESLVKVTLAAHRCSAGYTELQRLLALYEQQEPATAIH